MELPEATAYEVFETERLNAELLLSRDTENRQLFMFRIREWGYNADKDSMVLASAYRIVDAFALAITAWTEGVRTPLNWKVRLNEPGVYYPPALRAVPQYLAPTSGHQVGQLERNGHQEARIGPELPY